MSFSSRAKNELCQITEQPFCCKKAELAALVQSGGTIHFGGKRKIALRVNTANAGIARRVYLLLKEVYDIQTEVMYRKNRRLRQGNNYFLVLANGRQVMDVLSDMGIIKGQAEANTWISYTIDAGLIKKRCCKRAYLRGAFLGGGSVSDPEKIYHLEIVTHSEIYADSLRSLIESFDMPAKVIERKGNFVIYLKDGEHVAKFLNVIGAHSALLDLENIRIYKDVRNNVNRIVNCETANLNKTINAAMRQIENIQYLKDRYGLSKLSPPLKAVAKLRLSNPDASLKELGEMLDPPIGKSGVNHRLRKLDQIADDIRSKSPHDTIVPKVEK
ncbi:MAG: DNA-binding protein WhiA [Clostridiales bacterium]|nr:DNA-binding protein WhiA [Clostridiales bacterium]